MRRIVTDAKVIITIVGKEELDISDEDIILSTELSLNENQLHDVSAIFSGESFTTGLRFHFGSLHKS